MRPLLVAAVALAVGLAACGEDGESEQVRELEADLAVTVRPEGPEGPVRRSRIECERLGPRADNAPCRLLAGLRPQQLAPVPAGTACTQIYGGPATARVRGELLGRRVDARFELSDGCQIERWDRNRVLL